MVEMIGEFGYDYTVKDGIAIHSIAVIEKIGVLKSPSDCWHTLFIRLDTFLCGGVFGRKCRNENGMQNKNQYVFYKLAIAHFNFIGDSIIETDVNFEAGSVTANHFKDGGNKSGRWKYRMGSKQN